MKFSNFFENSVYELRSGVHKLSRNSRTILSCTESIIKLGAKLWNMIPENMKFSESLNFFKSKIKYRTPNKSLPVSNLQNQHRPNWFYNFFFFFFFCVHHILNLFDFNDNILKILFKIIVKNI